MTDGTHLWLLGRSGRGSWDPSSAGDCLVTLARSDVSVLEEADFVIAASGDHKRLQVRKRQEALLLLSIFLNASIF